MKESNEWVTPKFIKKENDNLIKPVDVQIEVVWNGIGVSVVGRKLMMFQDPLAAF